MIERILVYFMFFFIIIGGFIYHQNKISDMEKVHQIQIKDYENKLVQSEKKNNLKIEMIKDRVKKMNEMIKNIYPYYAYSEKVDDAINSIDAEEFNKKLDDLPIDLSRIYVHEYCLKVHGLDKYILKYPELGYPIDPKRAYIPTFDSEFGQFRSYPQFYLPNNVRTQVHEGNDIIAVDTTEILATYNAIVKNIYDWEGGKTIELEYYNPVRKHWCMDRFLHCDTILVNIGDKVTKGQLIAQYGNTGLYSKANHIHWSHLVWNGKKWIHYNVFVNSTWGNSVYYYVLARF